ncbi:hypothetical protein M378DRAFT_41939, partial [Amanita muscaria Koide BX008]
LQEELRNGYKCPVYPPSGLYRSTPLSNSEHLSLEHYITWKQTNSTVIAYEQFAKLLEKATNVPILSLHNARKLASDLTGLKAQKIDICPKSCIAYTGKYASLTQCPFKRDKEICSMPRYQPKKTPRSKDIPKAQMLYLSFNAVIRAMFTNADTSKLLRYRDETLKKVLSLLDQGLAHTRTYSDFADSDVHLHHYRNMGLFHGDRDIAWSLSTDGAQLSVKKQSNTWIVALTLLNLKPELRYKSDNVIIPFIVPGPHGPGDLESFL